MIKKSHEGKTNIKQPKEAIILVFLFAFLLVLTFFILILFSKIRIEIFNLKISSISNKHVNNNYKIVIKLCTLYKIPIIKVNLTKNKLEKLKIKEKIKKIDLKVLKNKNDIDKNFLKAIKKVNISIKKINLRIELGTENASLTAFLVCLLSSIISILFSKKVTNYEKQKYIINPIYNNQNIINMLISGIFEMKMIHIINIIYILNKNKKEGVKKNERTSNRRPYEYSYE